MYMYIPMNQEFLIKNIMIFYFWWDYCFRHFRKRYLD